MLDETIMTNDMEILAFIMSFFLIFLIIGIIFYVFLAVGLMKMAGREQIENAWLSWIPFAQTYIMGKLVSHKLGENSGWIVLGLTLLSLFSSLIPLLGSLIQLGIGIFMFVVAHWIYEKYSNKAVLMTIFTVITFGALLPIFIFAIRNNDKFKETIA